MKKLIFTLSLLFSGMLAFSQEYAVLKGAGEERFFKFNALTNVELQDLLSNYAQNGDTVYLPGVEFNISADLSLDKDIVLIGAGIHPDSASTGGALNTSFIGATTNDYFFVNQGASGGEIHGIRFDNLLRVKTGTNNNVSGVTNFLFNKCYFNYQLLIKDDLAALPNPTNCTVRNSVVNGEIYCENSLNTLISNSIIIGPIHQSNSTTQVEHNIFISHPMAAQTSNGGYFDSNIICDNSASITINQGLHYRNNLWVLPSGGVVTPDGNVLEFQNNNVSNTIGSVFVAPPATNPLTTFTFQANYHLLPNAANNYLGLDGTEVGIYGGLYPWKDGILPFNPHWVDLDLDNGNNNIIGVTIRATGQEQE